MEGEVVRRRGREVPGPEADRVTLARIDYLDQHVLSLDEAPRWSAEAWARAMFEDPARLVTRARELGLLGLLLSSPRPAGEVGGWRVVASGPDTIRLQSAGPLLRDEVLVSSNASGVALLTAVQYRRRIGAVVWPVVAVLHRRFAPRVLRRAHHRLLDAEVDR